MIATTRREAEPHRRTGNVAMTDDDGIPLSHLSAPILVLKCSYKAVWPIRRLNCVLALTGVVALKGTETRRS